MKIRCPQCGCSLEEDCFYKEERICKFCIEDERVAKEEKPQHQKGKS